MHELMYVHVSEVDPGFSDRWSEGKLKERGQECSPISYRDLNTKIIQFEHMFKQLSNQVSVATVASYMISAKINQQAWISRLIFAIYSSKIKSGS